MKPPTTGTVYLPDGDVPGLRLRVTAAGRMSWVLTVRDYAGKVRSVALGDYSGAGSVGLSDARERARRERQKLKDGHDTISERRDARIAQKARMEAQTLAGLLTEYEYHVIRERQKEGKGRSWDEAKRAISSVLAPFMSKPLSDLNARDMQKQIDGWPSKARAAATVRFVRPVLKWASKRHTVDKTLALELEQPEGGNRKRERILADDELSRIWQSLPVFGTVGAAFRMLLLTLARRSEVTGMTWREIDLTAKTWTLPADRSKNGRSHIVPLSRQALELLVAQPGEHAPDDLVFPNRAGGEHVNLDRVGKRIMALSETKGWTRHDLRRSSTTLLSNLGCSREILRLLLNHSDPTVTGRYDRAERLEEREMWLQKLADHIDAITSGNAMALDKQPG